MKKFLSLLMAACLCFSFASCSKSSNTDTETSNLHGEISKISNYLYESTFDNYEENYNEACEYFTKYNPKIGACSAVQNGYIRGRNYDWTLDEAAEFVIHVEANESRHASVGVATATALSEDMVDEDIVNEYYDEIMEGITCENVDSGKESELYKILPYLTLDGINDAGVTININVVNYEEKGTWTMKTEDTSDDVCPLMVCRLVLDKAGSVEEAIDLIKTFDIFSLGKQEEAHFMISGPTSSKDSTFKTVVVEFIPDEEQHFQVNVIDQFVDNEPIMTNFHLTGFDGSVTSLTKHPMGYERYLILKSAYAQGSTVSGMKDLMKKVYFTKAYDPYSDMIWYSEFASGDLTMADVGETKIDGDYSKAGAYADVLKENVDKYATSTRTSEEKGWHTVHTSVYDCENKTLSVTPQEGGYSFDFTIAQ